MNVRQKAAVVSTFLNFILTVLKFVLYVFTGSLVILAEAWHSFTDIFTSLMVLFSVSPRKEKLSRTDSPAPESTETAPPTLTAAWKRLSLEKRFSFFIGLLILATAIGVGRKVIVTPKPDIPSPFIYGIFFLIFAAGSYAVARFETLIGKKHNSCGLIADGLHSRADMVGSLIAGFVMILLQLGIDRLGISIDKIGAGIITVFILSFALDIFVNTVRALKGENAWREKVAAGLLIAVFDHRTWSKFLAKVSRTINWDQVSPAGRRDLMIILTVVLVVIVIVGLGTTTSVVIGPSQQGIRLRLGKAVNPASPLGPGLHYKLPWPLEDIVTVESRKIRSMNIGNIVDPRAMALLWTQEHGTELSFLTGEDYFIFPYVKIHYRIKDPYAYLVNFAHPEELLDNATHQLITALFSTREFYDIVIRYRRVMEETIKKEIQEKLDDFEAGLEIITVNTSDLHPPVPVAPSYEEVTSSLQEKEQMINNARGYANSTIPEAEGWAAKALSRARAYVTEKRLNAQGVSSRKLAQARAIEEYHQTAAAILYRDTMKEALINQPLILIDPAAGLPDIWLKLGQPIFLNNQF